MRSEEAVADQEVITATSGWAAVGVTLWLAFFGYQQKRMSQMATKKELADQVQIANDRFSDRREAIETRMEDFEGRVARTREDMQNMETRLVNEIHNSEMRLIAAFRGRHD